MSECVVPPKAHLTRSSNASHAKLFDIHIPLDIVPPVALKHILQIAQLAFAISPLILLVPRNGVTQAINKQELLLVGFLHSLFLNIDC
jgi:hypothetical protein